MIASRISTLLYRTLAAAALAASLVLLPLTAVGDLAKTARFDIDPQQLSDALVKYSAQSGIQVTSRAELLEGKTSTGVVGSHSAQDALKRLLEGTSLVYEVVGESTVTIRPASLTTAHTAADENGYGGASEALLLSRAGNDSRREEPELTAPPAQADQSADPRATVSRESGAVPELLVKGRRSMNTDIERTEDAPQPYVVFDNEEIQSSQAVNLEEFLRTRLPMNTAAGSNAQLIGQSNTTSSIDLRGLGSGQTLILVDGRRLPAVAVEGERLQPDLNGIPLSAVERIEVLPSTASGIYGGGATGGVVNIVLRRDFRGLETRATYGNTFDTDAAAISVDVNGGFSLEGGRTRVMIAATYAEANNLINGDRDFAARSRALQLANNPAAITGSSLPPLGATVNILSNTVIGGVRQPLTLDMAYGGTALDSTITHLPLGYAGPATDNGAALIANAGSYNLQLPDDLNGKQQGLLAAPGLRSAMINLRREFGGRFEVFLDLSRLGNEGSSFSAGVPNFIFSLPAGAPNNPFEQDIRLRFPLPGLSFESRFKSTTVRATGGLIVRLPHRWSGEVDYGWSRSRVESSATFFVLDAEGQASLGNGLPAADGRPALNVLQESNTFPLDFSPYLLPSPNSFIGPYDAILKDATLRLSGPVLDLPGGALSLSALIAHREEAIKDTITRTLSSFRTTFYSFYPERTQDADSFYLEARAPLIPATHAAPWAHALGLQASVRHDEYTTRSDGSSGYPLAMADGPFPELNYTTNRLGSTDYTLGLRYMPFADVTLRASFGTGFLPPSLTQVAQIESLQSSSFNTDPKRGNTSVYVDTPFTNFNGGGPGLRPEQSESWSAGMILTPRIAPGLRLSVDYTKIDKVDEIQNPGAQFILDNEDRLPGRIVRGPTRVGDDPDWAGPIISINSGLLNIARTSVEAYDIQVDYAVTTARFGDIRWYALATRQTHFKNQTLPIFPVVDSVGFARGPLQWRGNAGIAWDRGPLSLSWNSQYYDSYWVFAATFSPASVARATLDQGSPTVPSQIYHDLIASYRFDSPARGFAGLLADSEISIGIQNLFNESPPILASTGAVASGYSTYGDPRLRRYSISIRKRFE